MYPARIDTEIEGLIGYLDVQLDALRDSAFGLTEEQVRLTPCRSALSIGGIIKHATYVCANADRRFGPGADTTATPTQQSTERFMKSFTMGEEETLDEILEAFDAARERHLRLVRDSDPDAVTVQPPAFWMGETEGHDIANRYWMVHHIEELARHAGHADIIREQIDGATAPELYLAVNDLPGTPWLQPWTPRT